MKTSSFGALLKQYRMAAGLSQETLAERARISTRTISDLERGVNQIPRSDTLEALLQALSLSKDQQQVLISSVRPAIPAMPISSDPLYVLPLPPTELVGREQELSSAVALLRGHKARLLTLIGPAGVGKTHLALDIAHHLGADFKDGIVFVSLAPISDHSLVASQVARTLKLRETAHSSFSEQVCAFLSTKHLLLVLDNFEQVIDAASFVVALLQSCPHLRLLVTSRTPLRLRSEQQFPVGPLTAQAAVTLFLQRAQAIQPSIERNESIIAAICERLDRLPLAVELVAAQVKILPLPRLLERLTQRLPLLQSGARDLPERQKTMHTAIAWSYDLLSPPVRHLFCILGVCEGGCTEEALAFLASGEPEMASPDLLAHLTVLVNASLLQSDALADGNLRFRMLELIHEYAQEQLRATGQEHIYRERHVEYYTHLVETAITPGSGQEWIESELPNLRAALHWVYEQRKAGPGLRLANACGAYWIRTGQMSEGNLWLERMLELDRQAAVEERAPVAVRLAALYSAGGLARHLGHPDRSAVLAQEAVSLAEGAGDPIGMSNALALLGHLAQARADLEDAAGYFEQSYQYARMGDPKRSEEDGTLGRALANLASIARVQGNLARAQEILEGLLEQARANKMTWGIANGLTMLGHIAREQQQYALARSRYRESLQLHRSIGNLTYIALCLEGIAALACAEGNYEQATPIAAQAAALRLKARTPLPPNEQQAFGCMVEMARSALAEDVYAKAWNQGTALTLEEGIVLALSGLGEG